MNKNNMRTSEKIRQSFKPGSKEAVDMGCTCPVVDNHYGQGYNEKKGHYWMTADCPFHGFDPEEALSED